MTKDKTQSGVASHIQMPKLLLCRFENEKHFLAYYDVQKGIIGSNGHADSINTEQGYYSKEAEQYWNSQIEGDFSRLLKQLDSINTDETGIHLPADFDFLTKKYLHSLFARSPKAFKHIEDKSVFLQFMNRTSQHDVASTTMYAIAQKDEYFKDWIPTLLINKSEIPFILPTNGCYGFGHNGSEEQIVIPIHPQRAILLFQPADAKMYVTSQTIKFGLIEKAEITKRMNLFAFETQKKLGYGYIVSNDKSILQEAEEMYKRETAV